MGVGGGVRWGGGGRDGVVEERKEATGCLFYD